MHAGPVATAGSFVPATLIQDALMNISEKNFSRPVAFALFFFMMVCSQFFAKAEGVDTGESQTPQLAITSQDTKIKSSQTPKVGKYLEEVYQDYLEFQKQTSGKETLAPRNPMIHLSDGYVVIDAISLDNPEGLKEELEGLGLINGAVFGNVVSGRLPISSIDKLPECNYLNIAQPSLAINNAGTVTSQGDAAMESDIARTSFGVDGTGVTVGALSDSYNCLAGAAADIASGDLPSLGVTVLDDSACPGTDEGRAMLQIIHDVAPGAALSFHTAFLGIANFAQGIIDLADAGANVIVDDVIFFAEPMFQDGIIAQAVDTVEARGVAYFSSAGNQSRQSYEDDFRGGQFVTIDAVNFEAHDFDSGALTDTFQKITIPQGGQILLTLQWDSPSASAGGLGSPNDVDIFLVDDPPTTVIASSTGNNTGLDPVEILFFQNSGPATKFNLVIVKAQGANPGTIKYVRFRNSTPDEFDTLSSTTFGHANAQGAEAVGAAFWADTPAFGTNPPVVEFFSSAGGTPILFDLAGNRLPSPEIRNKPGIVGPDGGSNTFFGSPDVDGDGFRDFFGTSASAPHVAGLAALMLQENPGLLPVDIFSALESTAVDMDDPDTPGFDTGFDFATGAGLVQAIPALSAVEVLATDTTPPILTPPPNLTVEATGAKTPVAIGQATATDNVSAPENITITNNAPATFSVGVSAVTHTATDEAGNSATATQTITVIDTTPPSVLAPPGQIVPSTGELTSVNLGTASAFDLVDGLIIPTNDAFINFPGGFPVGTSTVTYSATDSRGNTRTATQTISVTGTLPPPPGTGTVIFEDGLVGSADTTLDTHTPDTVGTAWTLLFNDSTRDILLGGSGTAATGGDRNASGILYSAEPAPTQADVDITLDMIAVDTSTDDATILVFRYQDASNFYALRITADSDEKMQLFKVVGGTASLLGTSINSPDPSDTTFKIEARGDSIKVFEDPDQSGAFNLEIDVTDSTIPGAGKVGLGLGNIVLANDDIKDNVVIDKFTVEEFSSEPTLTFIALTPPPDVTKEATGPLTAVALGVATATDSEEGPLTPTNDAPAAFPVGVTIVTYSATNSNGFTATATQTVTVTDTTPPVLSIPGTVPVEATGPATLVALGTATASDLVDGAITPTNDATAGGFPVGISSVTYTATDSAGNSATALQTVTVIDSTPPSVTAPPDVTVGATGTLTPVNLGTATAADLADGAITPTNDASINFPGGFPVGDSIVTYSATDQSGNTGTATQTVTVTNLPPPPPPPPGAGTIIFEDGLAGSSGTPLDTHTPDTVGTAWTLLQNNSTQNILLSGSGTAATDGDDNGGGLLYSAEPAPAQADVDITLDMIAVDRSSDDSTILVFRYQDASNFYALRITADSDEKMQLFKVVGGTATLLGTSINSPDQSDTTFKVETRGDSLKVFEDPDQSGAFNLEIDVNDSAIPDAGKAGLGLGNIVLANDDIKDNVVIGKFKVEAFATGPPVTVPNVVGLTESNATAAITGAGLSLGTVTTQSSTTVPAGNVISQNPVAGVSVAEGSSADIIVSSGATVPNVIGLTETNATQAITGAGLVLGAVSLQNSPTVPAGSVISQNPVAGVSVVANSAVDLVVSSGPVQVIVPNVVGLTEANATAAITGANLVLGAVTNQSSPSVPAGSVISQTPLAGVSVEANSAVDIVVSTGVNTTPEVLDIQIAEGSDDAEERDDGSMSLTSSDLELTFDRGGDQKVGMRFNGLGVPKGATVTKAYIQFQVDEDSTGETSLTLQGEKNANPLTFTNVDGNISDRPLTTGSVPWVPNPWPTVGEAGLDQRTPDISAIIQEIINLPEWASGNSLAVIISGTGERTAESFNGVSSAAPTLHVEYSTAPDLESPAISISFPTEGATVSGTVNFTANASDNFAISSVQFRVDSENRCTPDTSSPYECDWDTALEGDGTVALTAVATDPSGNQTISDPLSVTIGNNSPDGPPPPLPSGTILVPEDHATIQEGVDAAGEGDLVLVSPGIYSGGITISGKAITLASQYHTTGDPALIDQTTIDGGVPGIFIDSTAPGTVIKGFRFTGGTKSIQLFANGSVIENHFDDTGSDAISFEDVGGAAIGNVCFSTKDDCIDADNPSEDLLIEKNIIDASGDDGIEIRNNTYSGPLVTITIRDNVITASTEDGIQLIDSTGNSDRKFIIEGNLIRTSAAVGLGLMDNKETIEDFRAASMPERIHVFNNTFDGNAYGITGGDNLVAVNNIISNSTVLGIKNIDNNSIVAHNLFFGNTTDEIGSNVDAATTFSGDPLFTGTFELQAGSGAIDAGAETFVFSGETVLSIPPAEFSGTAPDLGSFEFNP